MGSHRSSGIKDVGISYQVLGKANHSIKQAWVWSGHKRASRIWLASIRRARRKTTRSIHHNWRFPPVPIGGLVSTHITIAFEQRRWLMEWVVSNLISNSKIVHYIRVNTTKIILTWSSVSANLNTTRPSTIPWFRCLSTSDMCGGAPEHLGHVSILRPDFIKLLFRPSFKYFISRFQHPITPSTVVSVREAQWVS